MSSRAVVREHTRSALWVSTSLATRGGMSTFVRTLQGTPLWANWKVTHIATHRDGSVPARIMAFADGTVAFVHTLVTRRPDLVHLHTSSYGSFVRKATLAWLATAAALPVVLHVHGSEFGLFYERSPRLLQLIIRATLHRAAAVVALGDRWGERLRRIAPDARITVIPNAVHLDRPVVQSCGSDPVHVVFLGRIGDRKGTFTLLEAWALLAPAASTARLTIAGDGEVDRARDEIARLGVSASVEVLNWLTPERTHALLRSAHVLALPSRDEGQPMAVLEAMASGLCVVAGNAGGIPDLIDDGVTGLLVPPCDVAALAAALCSVITDHDTRARLGGAAHERACRDFDVEVVWKRLDALYQEVLT
ncbi:MAG: glycosyltransferase [Pseudonocardiaceae bacterium]|nr:glycosyltransferase [Pseudonocardiaceae bacterium]